MSETRVDRYKAYRQSFIKEGSISLDTKNEPIDIRATTSTLPIDEVINAVREEEKQEAFIKFEKKKYVIGIVLKISIAVILIAGLIILGIFAWRN